MPCRSCLRNWSSRRRRSGKGAISLDADDRKLPSPHPFGDLQEKTYRNLLGPLGKAEPTVWAECLFFDPIADIAVLGSPDNQELDAQAEAYAELTESVTPFAIADGPKMGTERIAALSAKFPANDIPTPGLGTAMVLSLDGKWLERPVVRHRHFLSIDDPDGDIKGGMSGSPILSPSDYAIGVVSASMVGHDTHSSVNPVLVDVLPPRIRPRC
jgi:hypothetical protein